MIFMAFSLWARFGVSAKKYRKCDGFLHVMFKSCRRQAEALRKSNPQEIIVWHLTKNRQVCIFCAWDANENLLKPGSASSKPRIGCSIRKASEPSELTGSSLRPKSPR